MYVKHFSKNLVLSKYSISARYCCHFKNHIEPSQKPCNTGITLLNFTDEDSKAPTAG